MSTAGPYSDEYINRIYQSLFCDNLALYENNNSDYPWDALFGESSTALGELLINPSTDSRITLMAANELRKLELEPASNRLLGIVLEVNLPEGLDTLHKLHRKIYFLGYQYIRIGEINCGAI